MTREDAITLIKKLRTFHNGTYAKAIDMAIEALYHHTEKTDNISTKVKSDLISREDAIEAVRNAKANDAEYHYYKNIAVDALSTLPSADRPQGEWTSECVCSLCGCQPWYERDIHTLNYCQNCGAEMER